MTRLFVTGTFRDKTFRYKIGTLYTWLHVIILYSTWPYQVHETRPATIIIEEEEEWFN